jgi:hypothetical protein
MSCSKNEKNDIKTYYSNGQIKYLSTYDKKRDLYQIIEFDSLGTKRKEYFKKNDLINGAYKDYFPNEQLRISANYIKGEKYGKLLTFYKNGKIQTKSYYKDGILDSEYLHYDKQGTLRGYILFKKDYYKPNVSIYDEQYDTNGMLKEIYIRPIVENLPDTFEIGEVHPISISITEKANTNFNYYFAHQIEKYKNIDTRSNPLVLQSDKSNIEQLYPGNIETFDIGFTEKGKYQFYGSCFIGDESIPLKDWQLSMDYHKIIVVR